MSPGLRGISVEAHGQRTVQSKVKLVVKIFKKKGQPHPGMKLLGAIGEFDGLLN